MRISNESGLTFSIFGLQDLEMAIKAKIKATALEPLFMVFFQFFLARSRVLGMDYHLKKFHSFPSLVQWFRGGCGIKREKVTWFFHDFLAFGPCYLIVYNRFLKFSFLLWLRVYFTTLEIHLWLYFILNFCRILHICKFIECGS